MIALETGQPRLQAPLETVPYDRWITPEGEVKAEFHRLPHGVLLRFPDEADFAIDLERMVATGWPSPDTLPDHFSSLFHHGVVPMVGNHSGGLFLHGSAVAVNGRAVAFLGRSRGGKTTLAAAFAKSGYPLLTEDVIDLVLADGRYWLQPKPSKLRLFADSASYLLGRKFDGVEEDDKLSLSGADALPFWPDACPLAAMYLLGTDHEAPLTIQPLAGQTALTQLLPHAFVLDVEDRKRLGRHFLRIAGLSESVACRALDYTREYEDLPHVLSAVLANIEAERDQ